MSGNDNEQDELSNSKNQTQTPLVKFATGKKLPFQTTQNNDNSTEAKLENIENIANEQSGKRTDAQIIKNIVNEANKPVPNLPEMVNKTDDLRSEGVAIKLNASKNENELSAENLGDTKADLNLIKLAENAERRQKIRSQDLTEDELDEICGARKSGSKWNSFTKTRTPGLDPRFQQQNQTLRCFVMYTDFYRCENILGEGEFACQWFKDVFTSICPLDWIRRWDEAREENRLAWAKGKSQGKFPGNRYGV